MKRALIIIGIPPVVGILGALLTEYVFKIGVLGGSNLKYFLIAGIIAAVPVFIISKRLGASTIVAKMSFAVSTVLGFLLIPYAAFLFGQIDIYMVDDNLIEGMSVTEVRPTMDKIVFGTSDGGEVTVWSGPQTLLLYPGKNRVKLGRFTMPAGTYRGGAVYIGDIEVDIQADFATMKDPVSGQSIPPDYYDKVFEQVRSNMIGNVGGFNINIVNSSLSGNLGTFTINVGTMTQPLPIPEFTYPGIGGPDITVDITLDEMGRPDPSGIKTIVDMPPGVSGAFPSVPGVEFR